MGDGPVYIAVSSHGLQYITLLAMKKPRLRNILRVSPQNQSL